MKEKVNRIVSNLRIVLVIYILFAVIASFQSYFSSKTTFDDGLEYNKYNNYVIFEKSAEHLRHGQDLYKLYPQEHWDLFKYTPSFSAFFTIFNVLPDWLGLCLWNLLNALILYLAIYYLPKLSNLKKGLLLFIVLLELLTSMQSEQSNGLIAGLLVLTFGLLERDKVFWASLCIVFSVFIKLFGIVGFVLFLFYPNKWKSIVYTVFWSAILLVIPLFFVDYNQYIKLFSSYLNLLKDDHNASYGFSVMGWIHTWFSVDFNKNIVVLIGIVVFLIPLVKIKLYKDETFRILMLCSVLLWIVIFNHKAESPTFIIAMAGVAIWYIISEKNKINNSLFILAMLLTSFSPTDLFPRQLRESLIIPYALKAFPCILIWIKISYELIKKRENNLQTIDPLAPQNIPSLLDLPSNYEDKLT